MTNHIRRSFQFRVDQIVISTLVPIIALLLIFLGSASIYPEKETYRYPIITEPLVNPLMGWAPWATIHESGQPHTLVYADLTWKDFEPQEGVYDFASFEEGNQIPRWREDGKRIVFRFIMDEPGDSIHMDIPDWLFDKMGGDGDFYVNAYGSGFSPNYANLILIDNHRKVISALGDKYSKNGLIAYIELGSLGHWGEWHVDLGAGIRPLPPESIRDYYVHHYLEAFPGTHLLMRRPFSIASRFNLGLYNDMTAEFSDTMTWLDWIRNGGEYSQTGEKNGLVPMTESWKIAPIGGEQTTRMSNEEIYGENLDQTIQLLKNSHTTFIGPGGPLKSEDARSYQQQIDQILAVVGYRYYFERVEIPSVVKFCNHFEGMITFSNNGIAPIYYNWPTYLFIFDEDKILQMSYPLEVDLPQILPGMKEEIIIDLPIDKLANGIYTLGIAIVDPITNQPAVRFGMKNNRSDLIFEIGSFEVRHTDFGDWLSNIPGICD